MDASLPNSDEFLREVAGAQSPEQLEQVRVRLLGRNGAITTLMRDLIEAGLAELDDTATVPLADVRRALAALATRAA